MADFDFTPDNLEAAGALSPTFDPGYEYPDDPQIGAALEHWRDLKFGVIIHWGIYTAIGQAGSWSLHRDRLGEFTDPPEDFVGSDADYHRWYYEQRHSFVGDDFDADQWATLCADAGMKYVVFTTKHHDGFAMYDTALSNMKSTAEDCPLSRDIFGEVTSAFRAHGMETGVYFSKADWARPDYWDLARPLHDRFANYDTKEESGRWDRFVDFSHAQIAELLSNYGPMNVLWLDAGWVRAPREDFKIDQLAALARSIQPGILIVDREVHGPHENYRTPEQELPDRYVDYPWESCMTWTRTWCSTMKDEPARPTWEIVANLLRIVARGGNYLVGFGPDSSGALSVHVERGLRELGGWMRNHGEGIYGTRALSAPPRVVQKSGADHDWFVVEKSDTLYLYGVPSDGACSAASVMIDVDVAEASILGGGVVQIAIDRGVSVLHLVPEENEMGYVVKLTRR